MNSLVDVFKSQPFINTILIGVLGGLVIKLINYIYVRITEYIYSYNNFTLNGIWLTKFQSYAPDKSNIEIVSIKQKKELIYIKIQQYANNSNVPAKFTGLGIFRSSELSAIYYPNNKELLQNGTILMRVVHKLTEQPKLDGFYHEFDFTTENNKIKIGAGPYILQRVSLPFHKKIKILCNINCFSSYSEIQKFVED